MKVTIVATSPDGWHQQELLKAGQNLGLNVAIKDLKSGDLDSGKASLMLGSGVVWRSSSLDIVNERIALLGVLKNKTVASDAVFLLPGIRFKYFQQHYMKSISSVAKWSIPTYKPRTKQSFLKLIQGESLQFPVIAKPNGGSRGEGIELLHSESDLQKLGKLKDYIFQNFIENDGDWRIIVIGGSATAAMKRIAQKGEFLNNVSRGASAIQETDPAVLKELFKISTKVASAFHLAFCGVDIIRDKQTGEYYVLEVNTAPQWNGEFGFKAITGVDVPHEVMQWVAERHEGKSAPLAQSVDTYYKRRIHTATDELLHFALRSWLWSRDEWSRQVLDQNQATFIGADEAEIKKTIDGILAKLGKQSVGVNQNKAYRKESFDRYPELPIYNALLFKTIFCDSVYDIDIRPYIQEHISDQEFMQLFRKLINDQDATRILSTHAVNYFYLLKNYFKDSLGKSSAVLVDPYELLALLPGYEDLKSRGTIDAKTSVKLQIYLLTHAIIGESRFYARPVKGQAFIRLCKEIERIIHANYFDVSLDNKFEFLVCAQLCGYESELRQIIESEAAQSLSWAGNFMVDTLNSSAKEPSRHCIRTSEHRNVLFLMSQRPFAGNDTVAAKRKKATKKRVIGRLARIGLPDHGIPRLVARVDSGASHSSIGASDITVQPDGLHFKLMSPDHYLYTGEDLVVTEYRVMNIKTTTKSDDIRYAVPLNVAIDGRTEEVLCTLNERSHMLFPMLLGRNFLTGKYSVDTEKQFVKSTFIEDGSSSKEQK